MKPLQISLLVFLCFFISIRSYLQHNKKNLKVWEKSDIVAEGQILDIELCYIDKQGNKLLYTAFDLPYDVDAICQSSATFQVCKIYRGENLIKEQTIKVITQSKRLSYLGKTIDSLGKISYGYSILPGSSHGEDEKSFLLTPNLAGKPNRYIIFGNILSLTTNQNQCCITPIGFISYNEQWIDKAVYDNKYYASLSARDTDKYVFEKYIEPDDLKNYLISIPDIKYNGPNLCK